MGGSLEEKVGRLLRDRGMTLAVAESCTGGLIAHTLTNVPGSSDYFERGFVTYSNEAKTEELDVQAELVAEAGAVSAQVARAMAEGALSRAASDVAVSATGIAGPTGGTTDKPVGLVFVALAAKDGLSLVEEHRFSGARLAVKEATCRAALELLRRYLAGEVLR